VPTIYLYIGPTLVLAQNLAPAGMRSQICAFILFTANIANLAVAPLLIEGLSNLLAPHLSDPRGCLRWVLVATPTGFWAVWHYRAAARPVRQGLEKAGSLEPPGLKESA
jgi:hypothetical protein